MYLFRIRLAQHKLPPVGPGPEEIVLSCASSLAGRHGPDKQNFVMSKTV